MNRDSSSTSLTSKLDSNRTVTPRANRPTTFAGRHFSHDARRRVVGLALLLLITPSACSGGSGSGSDCNGGPNCGEVSAIDTPGGGLVVARGRFPGSDPTGPHQLLMVLTPTGQTQGKRLVPDSFSETEATYSRWSQLTGAHIAPGSYDVYFEMGGYVDSKGDTGIVVNHAPSPIQVR